MDNTFIGIDPGSRKSGFCVIRGNIIQEASNLEITDLYKKITPILLNEGCKVVIEDIRPYSMRLTPDIITTIKLISELTYRLKNEAGVDVNLITRYDIKKWVFDTFPDVAIPIIDAKIKKKGGKNKAYFVYVNDKIVTEAMKKMFRIPTPPPGSGYQFGLKDHSWQALATVAYFYFSTS